MDWLRQFRFKLRGLWRDRRREAEMVEEMRAHLENLAAANRDAATSPDEARDRALRQFGNVSSIQERARDEWRFRWFEEFRTDLRFAIRQLKRAPAFTLVAALTLALGIGANSAMFALADATLMRKLPYGDPERLVMIWERTGTSARSPAGLVNLRDWDERNRSFEAMAAITLGLGGGPLLEAPDGTVESVDRQSVSTRFFDVLGIIPVAGRTFLAEDERPGTSVVVMSERLWRRRFGSDRTIIGRVIQLNGQPNTVVGVVPDHVQFARPASIWTLLPPLPANQRGLRIWQGIGRLKHGVTLESAQADLSVIADQLAREFPSTNKDRGVTIEPLRSGIMGPELQLTSILLLGVVGFVLLMCCANVANLLLARARVRARELAVRSALGAGRGRIVRQLLTESLTLAALGGALGIAVGAAILKVAPALIPPGLLPAAVTLTFDGRVVAFCGLAALVVGLLFGLMPALQATSTSLVEAIASESRTATRSGGQVRSLLAVGQIAAAVLLLCGAGLLLRTLWVLGNVEAGYGADSDSVVTLDFSVPVARYRTPERLLQFYEAVEREVRVVPNVRRVGWSTSLPAGNAELGRWPFEIVGDTPTEATSRPTAEYTVASDGYFQTLDIPIVAGRGFTERDSRDTTPVCLVNEEFVRRHLGGRDPIGARVSIRPGFLSTPAVREIVGVARQVKGRPDATQELLQVYVPLAQAPYDDVYLVVQADNGRPETLVPAIRAAVARQDVNVPVRRIRTLRDLADEATVRYRFRAVIVATFAGLALLLALVGVFAVLSYSVQQRSREFGMRIALGATTADVLALVVMSATRVISVGAILGLLGAVALARSISTFLYGVQPLDPLTFGSVAVVLAVTAGIAMAAPALRAAQTDPVVTLRGG
jgi:putative ABC transport system permease protein